MRERVQGSLGFPPSHAPVSEEEMEKRREGRKGWFGRGEGRGRGEGGGPGPDAPAPGTKKE